MQSNINYFNSYIKKQNSFVALVKSIQYYLQTKEYKQYNYSLDEFVKMKWNISKAQAYRYLISAKVIDQLQEFQIKPCYERICRALYNVAKTPKQMKLLWGSILKSAGNRPDCINSSHIKKMWKKLSEDKKYDKICHFEDEIMNRVENASNKNSSESKNEKDHENETSSETEIKNEISSQTATTNVSQYSYYPSPLLNENVISSSHGEFECQYIPLSNLSGFQSQPSYYPSPIPNISTLPLNGSVPYNTFSSSVECSHVNLLNNITDNQLSSNSNTVSSDPSISFIELQNPPVQYISQPVNIQHSKLSSEYQEEPQILYTY